MSAEQNLKKIEEKMSTNQKDIVVWVSIDSLTRDFIFTIDFIDEDLPERAKKGLKSMRACYKETQKILDQTKGITHIICQEFVDYINYFIWFKTKENTFKFMDTIQLQLKKYQGIDADVVFMENAKKPYEILFDFDEKGMKLQKIGVKSKNECRTKIKED